MAFLTHTRAPHDRVDFAAVKAASMQSIERLLEQWLPGGFRRGNEYLAINPTRADANPGSFSINTKTGVWSDFASGESGGDMVDLYKYLNGGELIDAFKEVGSTLGVPLTTIHQPKLSIVSNKQASSPAVVLPADASKRPTAFPERTKPDADGKPRFIVGGDEGPVRRGDELRRHVYNLGHTPVRIKVIRKDGQGAVNWYRVSDGGISGWQMRKPEGFKACPYVGVLDAFNADPFASDQAAKPLWWAEGEKDAETVADKGGLAFTFGGTGDGLPAGCEEYARDRDVFILADNDAEGEKHAQRKAALIASVAKSVRVIGFPELPPKGDVSDYFRQGASFADLEARAKATPLYRSAEPTAVSDQPALKATPYTWQEPGTIPRRDFVYGRHLIRKFVSATVAPGGVGKSSLIVTECIAMASGIDLLGVRPTGRSRVWLWNLEDPAEEMARHIQATALHYNLKPRDIDGYLFADSGRDQRLVIATSGRDGAVILRPVVDALVAEIQNRGIDALIVDPFVSSHEVSENDNGAMDRVVKEWGKVAQRGNCAVELVHHSRKSSAGETEITVESSRGGKAMTDGCRSVRVLNRMSKEEGENAGVENPRVHFRTYIDKSNLAPPAETSTWFKLESVDLGNGAGGYGDSVGVVIPWQWPDLMADVTVSDLRNVQAVVAKGSYRADVQSPDWVGNAIAEACRLDLNKATDKRKATNLLKIWLSSGALKKQTRKDTKGNDRPFIVVGEWAND